MIIFKLFTTMKGVGLKSRKREKLLKIDLFYEALSHMEWNLIYFNSDMRGKFTEFHDKLTTEYNRYFPKKQIHLKYDAKRPGYMRVYNGLYKLKLNCTENIWRLTHWPLGNLKWNFRYVIFKQVLLINSSGICCEIALIWMSLDFTDDQSTLTWHV